MAEGRAACSSNTMTNSILGRQQILAPKLINFAGTARMSIITVSISMNAAYSVSPLQADHVLRYSVFLQQLKHVQQRSQTQGPTYFEVFDKVSCKTSSSKRSIHTLRAEVIKLLEVSVHHYLLLISVLEGLDTWQRTLTTCYCIHTPRQPAHVQHVVMVTFKSSSSTAVSLTEVTFSA